MNKSLLAGAILVVIGGGAVAATSIGDKRINALYAQNDIGMLHNFTVDNKDLGFTGGQVSWTADLILDPCKLESIATLRGMDTIHKGLTGYTIDTAVEPVLEDPEMRQILEGLPALQVTTKVGWTGNGDMSFVYPAGKLSNEDAAISWDSMTGNVDFSKQDDDLVFEDLDFSIPVTSLDSDAIHAQLNNMTYTSTTPIGYTLGSGEAEFEIESFEVADTGKEMHLAAKDVLIKSVQEVNADTVDVGIAYEFGPIELGMDDDNMVIDNMAANVDFIGINRPAIETIYDTLENASKECIPQSTLADTLQAPILDILSKGLKIESKDNLFKVGEGSITADATIVLPVLPEQSYDSLEEASMLLASQAKYDVTVAFDKALLQSISNMGADNTPILSGDIDSDWKAITDAAGADVTGDKAVIHKSN